MSKSLGNVLSPSDAMRDFTASFPNQPSDANSIAQDCLRYVLLRGVCLNEDTTFSLPLAKQTVNTELVNWLGNLLSR